MKAILFTDIHLGLAQDSPDFHKITVEFGEWMADEARKRDIKMLICGGDVFHNRKSISLSTINAAYNFFECLKEFDIRIITGNHDCLYLENSDIHSISLLKEWNNISVYDSPYYENFDGNVVGFIPWGTGVQDMQKCDVMFGHYEITGYQMGPKAFCEHGMSPTELLKKCPKIFSGHFHKPQVNSHKGGDIIYMGSPFQHNWGEAGQDKFIYELDFKTKDYKKIENTVSPKHIEIKDEKDIAKAEGNIVRVYSDSKDSKLIKKIEKSDLISVDAIIEDKEIKKAAETIKDFKGVDVMDGFKEVVQTIEGINKTYKKKVLDKVKDIYSKV